MYWHIAIQTLYINTEIVTALHTWVLAFLVDISTLKRWLPPVQLRNHYQTTAQKWHTWTSPRRPLHSMCETRKRNCMVQDGWPQCEYMNQAVCVWQKWSWWCAHCEITCITKKSAMLQKPYLFFHERVSLLPTLLKMGCSKTSLGHYALLVIKRDQSCF